MRGVILAGGEGTRLRPLTETTNKHLLPIGDVPMIVHPLRGLVAAGVCELLVVSSRSGVAQLAAELGSGAAFGCELTFRVQEKAAGIADALSVASGYARNEPVVVVLGDNLFDDDLAPHLSSFESGARVFLAKVADPERFGVAEIADGRIVDIVEKVEDPPSDWAVTGIYVYDGTFPEVLGELTPSSRGELEITDLNRSYLARGTLDHRELRGRWIDAGTRQSYDEARRLFGGSGA